MNTFNDFMTVFADKKSNSCSAEQGLHAQEARPAQLHQLRGNDDHREFFALVLSVRNGQCRIIPGSLDAYGAGTGDIILPRTVMGGCVSLSPSLQRSVPTDALGEGFARLDDDSFGRVMAMIDSSAGKNKPYRYAFPFVGDGDSRCEIRHQLVLAVNRAVNAVRVFIRERLIRTPWRRPNPFASRELFQREWRLAAADSAKPISATRKLEGFEGSLLIRYAPDDRELRIRAFDAAGEKTDALDGWAVLGPDADVLGYFDGAVFTAKVPSDFDGGIRILDIDGNSHDLIDEA